MQRVVLHITLFVKEQGGSCLLVSAPMAIYEKRNIYRHGSLVVRAFASQSKDLDSSLVQSDQKT